MTDKIQQINTVSSPATVALISAFDKAIEEIAEGTLTPVEVIGALEYAKMRFHFNNLALPTIIED